MSSRPSLPSIFACNGLTDADYDNCLRFACAKCPDRDLQVLQEQGGCSLTLRAPNKPGGGHENAVIIQIRLPQYAVSIPIASAAAQMYPFLAPQTRELGHVALQDGMRLQLLEMLDLSGQRFSELQPRTPTLTGHALAAMLTLVRSLATFFAMQWSKAASACAVPGRIGGSIVDRLQALERDLPTAALRQRAAWVRQEVKDGVLNTLPTVLTHGDLIPSNTLVDQQTWRIVGLIDWAEAEWLPFGISLYGLEHLLGYLEKGDDHGKSRFCYYTQARELWDAFWTEIEQQRPEIVAEPVRSAVDLARDAGILLWHGIAWDGGRLDRVIGAYDDEAEFELLQAFLEIRPRQQRHDSVVYYSRPVRYVE